MNMKVLQTLVWLNLLSFGTKDLAEPTIGIQSAANHKTLLRHFCLYHTSKPTLCPAVTAWECDCEKPCCQIPPGLLGQFSQTNSALEKKFGRKPITPEIILYKRLHITLMKIQIHYTALLGLFWVQWPWIRLSGSSDVQPPPPPYWPAPWALLYWPALLSLPYRPGRQGTDPQVFSAS